MERLLLSLSKIDHQLPKKKSCSHNLSLIFIFVLGFGLILFACQPFFSLFWSKLFSSSQVAVYPLVLEDFLIKIDRSPKILGDFTNLSEQKPVIIDDPIDYSNLENWFSGAVTSFVSTRQSYFLDIEKLGIRNALVRVGGNNIDQNLVHFNSDVAIGDYGAPVIFGHSILRQFYNPRESNKDRYKSIFSTIMTLEKGDRLKVRVGDLTYTYQVVDKKEVQPDDDYILAQNPNVRQLKLVTCTPEGTFLRRGVITAELVL